jgi:hypothetical protein
VGGCRFDAEERSGGERRGENTGEHQDLRARSQRRFVGLRAWQLCYGGYRCKNAPEDRGIAA